MSLSHYGLEAQLSSITASYPYMTNLARPYTFTHTLSFLQVASAPLRTLGLCCFMSLIRRNRDPQPAAGPSSSRSDDRYKLAFERIDSRDTLESDTARNQRGPGHSLEVIYSFFGAQLEKFINKLVVKSGRTPTAV